MIFQIDLAREEDKREKHHICVKKESNDQSNDDEQQKTNRDVRCDSISLFEIFFFVDLKHKDHMSRN
jgi:hypothetical protein